jgi:hypothetical protein
MTRRGGILMEAVTAMMLLSLLVISTGQIMTAMNRQSRLLSQRATALQECQNALARVAGLGADEVSGESLAGITLPAEAAEILPEGELKVSPVQDEKAEAGIQLKATVRWRPAAHAELAETSLSLWRFDLAKGNITGGGAP